MAGKCNDEIYFETMAVMDPKKPDVRVELEWIGEGYEGDYDPEDPEDVPLLRFTVYRREGDWWEQVSDASYCTCLPVTTPRAVLAQALKRIYDDVVSDVREEKDLKRICEDLSYISPSWFEVDVDSFNRKCMETVADIATTAGFMAATGQIAITDSRTLVQDVLRWAENFNIVHLHNDWNDVSYIEAVDDYAEDLLKKHYGVGSKKKRAGA